MNTENESSIGNLDPAAVFASALSLWQACQKYGMREQLNLGECYNGMDQLMRVIMGIAKQFEAWACEHVDFKGFSVVWPYHLEDGFGAACLAAVLPTKLNFFCDSDCLRIALRLNLPVIVDGKLPVPYSVSALNPVPDAPFRAFMIQTVRNSVEGNETVPYTAADDPFDADFGTPYVGLYGVCQGEKLEHIADRRTYGEALDLVRKIAPGVQFPPTPEDRDMI